jgi:hypothetical protein
MTSIPINDKRKSISAIASSLLTLRSFPERMDANENKQEAASIMATRLVISSIKEF